MARLRLVVFSALSVLGMGVADRAHADLMVASFQTDEVLRYDATGAFVEAFVPAASGGLDNPRGLTFGPDGHLYVGSTATNSVLRYNGTTGAFIDAFVSAGSGGLTFPFDLAFGPDGNLYVASPATDQVLRYNGATGGFIDVFASGGVPSLNTPRGLAFTGDHLFVSGEGDRVWRFDAATGAFDASLSGFDNPRDITLGPDGNLYVGFNVSNLVSRRAGATGAFIDTFVASGSGGLASPLGLLFGPDGALYISSVGTDEVLRYDGATGAFIDTFVGSGSGGLSDPQYLAFTPEPVPEPATVLLVGGGLAVIAGWRRGRRRKSVR